MSRVLVTGANGFVGAALYPALAQAGHLVRGAVRDSKRVPRGLEAVVVGDIGGDTDWRAALAGIDVVVHAAARVHNVDERAGNEALYFDTNAVGTRQLARAAVEAGVTRLVLLSSVKVNGEGDEGRVYRADDVPAPLDDYGRSKLAAETLAFQIAEGGAIEVVVLRMPLVYGPGVKANFLKLMHWVWRRYPLPLGSIDNRRSLIGLRNLCDAICRLVEAQGAAGQVWLASDGEDVSTPALVRRIARALDVEPRLVAVPEGLLRVAGRMTGRGPQVSRLCGSLQVDSSPLRDLLDWRPPWTLDEELAAVAAWFKEREVRRDP